MTEILIADDSNLIRMELENGLKQYGYSALTVGSGPEALAELRKNADIRLLITDLNMPDMTGIELVEKIRTELNNTLLKVIIISTETNSSMRRQCKQLNVSGWALKPLNVESMLPTIKRLTETKTA